MAWGAAATGTRAATGSVGQGLSLMQESLSEIAIARLPLVVLNMARAQGDYFQATRGGGHGDYRHLVLAPVDVPEAVQLIRLAFQLADEWRNPVLLFGDYYLAHSSEAVDTSPIDFGPVDGEADWALDGSSGGSGGAKLMSPLWPKQGNDPESALRCTTAGEARPPPRSVAASSRSSIPASPRTPSWSSSPSAHPAATSASSSRELRAAGLPVGYVRPISLCRSRPSGRRRAAAEGQGRGRLRDEHRPDDRRRAPGRVGPRARSPSSAASASTTPGSASSSDLDVEISRERLAPCSTRRRGPHDVVADLLTDRPTAEPAQVVDDFTPALIDCRQPPPVPGLRRAHRHAFRPRGGRRARPHPRHHRRIRHRVLHGVLEQPRRRGAAGAARPGAVSRHRGEAGQARHLRLHRSRRRGHGQRRAAGGPPYRRPG